MPDPSLNSSASSDPKTEQASPSRNGSRFFSVPMMGVLLFSLLLPLFFNPYLTEEFPSLWLLVISYLASASLCMLLVALCSKVRFVGYVIIPLFAIVSLIVLHTKSSMGIFIDYQIIASVIETNSEEASGFINTYSVSLVTLVLIASLALVHFSYRRLRPLMSWRHFGMIALACAALQGLGQWALPRHKSFVAIPYRNALAWPVIDTILNTHHVKKYYTEGMEDFAYLKNLPDPKAVAHPTPLADDDEIIAVFHIGESVRADHLQLNGYPRETTPLLMTQRDNIVSFKDTYSYGLATRVSVVGMLTDAEAKTRRASCRAFFSVFNQSGFQTCSLSEAGGSSVHESSLYLFLGMLRHQERIWIDTEAEHKFGISVEKMKQTLAQFAQQKRLFICMYDTGAHVPFIPNPSAAFFTPYEYPKRKPLKALSNAINSYDNVIREIDQEIFDIITPLKDKVALYIYFADHGVALGDDNTFSAGSLVRGTSAPAFFIWYSDKYQEKYPHVIEALRENSKKLVSHDNIFHTIPSLCFLRSDKYKEKLDLCNPHAEAFEPPADLSVLAEQAPLENK